MRNNKRGRIDSHSPNPSPPQLGNRAIKKLRNKYFCAIITYSEWKKDNIL